jgi:hypothetical protein
MRKSPSFTSEPAGHAPDRRNAVSILSPRCGHAEIPHLPNAAGDLPGNDYAAATVGAGLYRSTQVKPPSSSPRG